LSRANISLELESFIALYKTTSDWSTVDVHNYAEVIKFQKNGEILISPVTENALKQLKSLKDLAIEYKAHYFEQEIPKSLIYVNTITGDCLWRVPECVIKINSTLECFSGKMSFPDIILMFKKQELYAYGEFKNQLYCLDLPHYENKNQWVCLGEVKGIEKELSINKIINMVTAAWKDNNYNSLSHTDKDEDVLVKLWDLTYKNVDEPWNNKKFKHLKKCQLTIADLIKSIT
jgi:hypothetical protein